jgi:hypothetical protein
MGAGEFAQSGRESLGLFIVIMAIPATTMTLGGIASATYFQKDRTIWMILSSPVIAVPSFLFFAFAMAGARK